LHSGCLKTISEEETRIENEDIKKGINKSCTENVINGNQYEIIKEIIEKEELLDLVEDLCRIDHYKTKKSIF